MSIIKHNKDHLKEHADVALAAPVRIEAPKSDDPLMFWTQHDEEPCEVNLHPFATGQTNHPKGSGYKFISFTGRPQLIRQLAPAIEETLLWLGEGTVRGYLNALRNWWRVLDAVECGGLI